MPLVGSNSIARMPVAYLGIDPGTNGALVALSTTGEVLYRASMPDTERDLWDWIRGLRGFAVQAVIEQVGGFIKGQDGGGHPGSAMFKFGKGYGNLRMGLVAAGIPFEEATPQKWQKIYSMSRAKTESKGEWKNRLKAKAQQLFPQEKITLALADAFLIAEFCRRKHEGVS